jgi:hypothetical protein
MIEIGDQSFVAVPLCKEFSAFLPDGFGALGCVLKQRGDIAKIGQCFESQIVPAGCEEEVDIVGSLLLL